jgi:hypothetical protein
MTLWYGSVRRPPPENTDSTTITTSPNAVAQTPTVDAASRRRHVIAFSKMRLSTEHAPDARRKDIARCNQSTYASRNRGASAKDKVRPAFDVVNVLS